MFRKYFLPLIFSSLLLIFFIGFVFVGYPVNNAETHPQIATIRCFVVGDISDYLRCLELPKRINKYALEKELRHNINNISREAFMIFGIAFLLCVSITFIIIWL